jgi:hypothetical protein
MSCPNVRTSGEGLNEYWSSGTFSAALVMNPFTMSKAVFVADVSGFAAVCAAAGVASARTTSTVHTVFMRDLLPITDAS